MQESVQASPQVRKFRKYHDLPTLKGWLNGHGLPSHVSGTTPKRGYIASILGVDVAMCFLRKCEGGLGLIEGLCTNPIASSQDRAEAIDLVVNAVIEDAKTLGMQHLASWCANEQTLVRAPRYGFHRIDYPLITKSIG